LGGAKPKSFSVITKDTGRTSGRKRELEGITRRLIVSEKEARDRGKDPTALGPFGGGGGEGGGGGLFPDVILAGDTLRKEVGTSY